MVFRVLVFTFLWVFFLCSGQFRGARLSSFFPCHLDRSATPFVARSGEIVASSQLRHQSMERSRIFQSIPSFPLLFSSGSSPYITSPNNTPATASPCRWQYFSPFSTLRTHGTQAVRLPATSENALHAFMSVSYSSVAP